MAKKARKKVASTTGEPTKRRRRSAEERIADLQAEIKRLEAKKKAREIADSEAMKGAMNVIRSIDKALAAAEEENNSVLRHVLVDTRSPLADWLTGQGLDLPKARKPRGRRPKGM